MREITYEITSKPDGSWLVLSAGENFYPAHHPRLELKPDPDGAWRTVLEAFVRYLAAWAPEAEIEVRILDAEMNAGDDAPGTTYDPLAYLERIAGERPRTFKVIDGRVHVKIEADDPWYRLTGQGDGSDDRYPDDRPLMAMTMFSRDGGFEEFTVDIS